MALVTNDNINLEKVGYGLYHTNKTMQKFANIMEHPEFSEFFKTHFASPTEAVATIRMLYLYESIKDKTPEESGYTHLGMFWEAMQNQEIRAKLFHKSSKLLQ